MTTADACTREALWLQTTGDSLPALAAGNGGPWDVIQAYWPRTPERLKTGIYVMRRRVRTTRWTNQRRIPHYAFRLRLWWPVGATTTGAQLLEEEQAAFDVAVDLLIQRLEGTVGDKTHGGRFMSVGEAPDGTSIDVDFEDPEQSFASSGVLAATASYDADDRDYTM